MIIECINCNKVFDVNSELIPSKGRTIQCGSCNHVWFYNLKQSQNNRFNDPPIQDKNFEGSEIKETNEKSPVLKDLGSNTTSIKAKRPAISKNTSLVKYKKKTVFTFGKLLNSVLVLIISFIALIIVLDTFKSPLTSIFPNLELILYNLLETLKDLLLFVKDLM